MRFLKKILCVMSSVFMTGCLTEPVPLPEKYLLFDVRSLEEYQAGRLSGAVLLPYDTIRDRIGVVAPDKAAQIFLYCHSGGRAMIAKKTMQEMGYTAVVNLGGLSAAAKKTQLKIIQ